MKKFLQFFAGALLAATVIFTINVAFTPADADAQINRSEPLPTRWGGAISAFGLTEDGRPQLTVSGTIWTGITTNLALTNTTFRLNIINGIVVGTSTL